MKCSFFFLFFVMTLYSNVTAALDEILKRYERPFTLLLIGEDKDDFIAQATSEYKESVFVVFGKGLKNLPADNLIILNHMPSLNEMKALSLCEHVDITLLFDFPGWFLKDKEERLHILQTMSHIVVKPDGVLNGIEPFHLVKTTLIHPRKKLWSYEIVCDYQTKYLRKIRPNWQGESEWLVGINLMTYAFFDGIVPSRKDLITHLPVDYEHSDYTPNNLIVQGKKLVLIDKNDPVSTKVVPDGGERFRYFEKKVKQFLLSTRGLSFERIRNRFLSIYECEKQFEKTEVDE